MSATSPGAYGISMLVHGAAVGLVLFFSYAASNTTEDSPKVLELVAGQGDNYGATEAPALGVAGGVKLETPPVEKALPLPTPAPAPQPVAPPIQSAPLEAVPAPAPLKPAKQPKPVDLLAELKKVEARRERRLEEKYKKEMEAEQKRLTHEEFLKQQAAAKLAHVDAEGIREGVIGGSTNNKVGGAGGKALTREEGSELEAYFSLLKSRIKENHTPPEGVSDSLSAKLEFFVAADGSLSHVRIVRSSGNSEFDRSVTEACEHTHSIGPRPDGRSETVQMTFKMREDESP